MSLMAMLSEHQVSCLLEALTDLVVKLGSSPLELNVSLCDSKVVEAANQQIKDLERDIAKLRADYKALENNYCNQVASSLRLIDYCRAHDFELPPRIFTV